MLTRSKPAMPFFGPTLECLQVEVAVVQHQPVAAGAALDRTFRQLVAQAGDVGLDRPSRRFRRLVPEIADESLEWDCLPGPEQE